MAEKMKKIFITYADLNLVVNCAINVWHLLFPHKRFQVMISNGNFIHFG